MEWISVKKKMPEPFVPVIVLGGVGMYNGFKWTTLTGYAWPGQDIAWEVKFWMPLPLPPESENKAPKPEREEVDINYDLHEGRGPDNELL